MKTGFGLHFFHSLDDSCGNSNVVKRVAFGLCCVSNASRQVSAETSSKSPPIFDVLYAVEPFNGSSGSVCCRALRFDRIWNKRRIFFPLD